MSRKQSLNRAFSLLEIVVVIAITAVLASLAFVVAAPMREKSRQTVCAPQTDSTSDFRW